jgi:hypothetical protein
MRCEDTPAQLADYLAGSLNDTERNALESHAQTCPACREELDRAAQMWQMLGDIPAERADSHAMRARFRSVLAGAIATEQKAVPAAPRDRIGAWIGRYFQAQPLLQGCAALLVLLIGIQVGRGTRPPPPTSPDVQQLSTEVRDLRQMVTLSLLQQQSASERLKGVSWSSQLDRPGDEVVTALIDTLMHDANVNVRLASIDALKRFADREAVKSAAVHALDTQRSPLVQMALIDFVVETQDHRAVEALRKLSRDSTVNEAVRARAMWGLDHLEIA